MSINCNNQNIAEVYFGRNPINKIYCGAHLVYCRDIELKINSTPENALVEWTVGTETYTGTTLKAEYGTEVNYKVSLDGYWWEKGTIIAKSSKTINVNLRRSDFPREWGVYKKGKASINVDYTGKNWGYAFSLHFANGTLPMAIYNYANSITLDKTQFGYDVFDDYNGGTWRNGILFNSKATNEENYMLWQNSAGTPLGSMVYPTALFWGWPNSSVYTNDIVYEVNNNELNIYKSGTKIATFIVITSEE